MMKLLTVVALATTARAVMASTFGMREGILTELPPMKGWLTNMQKFVIFIQPSWESQRKRKLNCLLARMQSMPEVLLIFCKSICSPERINLNSET